MPLKKHDFVEIEYTGILKDENIVFDTTDEKTAKENNIYSKEMNYGPVIICIGEKQIIQGLDDKIIGKALGKYTIEISPEEGFGKKDAKLLQLIPLPVFKKQNIEPFPGLQVNIDGMMGTVKTTGSRVIVDFNHPLSGRNLIYEIKINKIVEDDKEKANSYFKMMGIDAEVKEEDKKLKITTKTNIPEKIAENFSKKLKEIIGKDVVFEKKEKQSLKEEKQREKG